MKTESLKNFSKFYKSFGIKDQKIENLCTAIWNESRASAESEEKQESYKQSEKEKEFRDKLYYLKTEAIPDCVFVTRNFGNKWVRNQSYGYFKKEKWIVRKEDGHASWNDTTASFNGFEIEEYSICELEWRRLPEPPQKINNLYFLDDLVFRRDLLSFIPVYDDEKPCLTNYLPHVSGELDKEQIQKIESLIKICKSRSNYSYRFDGEPCYIPIRFAMPPFDRQYKQKIYHKEIDDRRALRNERERWEFCPMDVKIKIVKLCIQANRAKRKGKEDLEFKLKDKARSLFPNKVVKPTISLPQWKTMSKIAKLNTAAGAINEYHKSN